MVVRVLRLGSARTASEGPRIGTVRRPPRGVPKAGFASRDWYDVWFPNLAPSVETMKLGQAATPAQWAAFTRKYRAEMAAPDASHAIALLATRRAPMSRRRGPKSRSPARPVAVHTPRSPTRDQGDRVAHEAHLLLERPPDSRFRWMRGLFHA